MTVTLPDRRRLIAGALSVTAIAAAPRAGAIDAAALARTLATLVEREYPFVDTASAIARSLRGKLKAGRYRGLDAAALADALTGDLREVGHDLHLRVTFAPDEAEDRTSATTPPGALSPDPPAPPEASPRARAIFAPDNWGVVRAQVLPGNIGLVQVDGFVPLYDVTRARFGAAMTMVADTYGLVLDLRSNGGGRADSAAHLVGYFFDREPFVLDRLVWRRGLVEETRTDRDNAGPGYGERRPVAVAVGPDTFSAAESVAYDLQVLKRAVVVGENTRGGANPGDFFNLGQGFVAFVPQGRAVNAVTGSNWEGVGVRPEVASPAAQAVEAARRTVIEAALAQPQDGAVIEALRAGLPG
jgi:hypothetical protein